MSYISIYVTARSKSSWLIPFTLNLAQHSHSHVSSRPAYSNKSITMPPLTGDPKNHDLAKLNKEGMTGSCNCGAITVTLTQEDLFAKPNGHICHCANCRKFSGSAPNIIRIPKQHVKFRDPQGLMKTYMDFNTVSGGPLPRGFCSNCGSGELDASQIMALLNAMNGSQELGSYLKKTVNSRMRLCGWGCFHGCRPRRLNCSLRIDRLGRLL